MRRALLSRIVRMLDQKYGIGRRRKDPSWKRLDDFFWRISSQNIGFISMNWDTVIERKLALTRQDLFIDYSCDALAANIPALPNEHEFLTKRDYKKELRKNQIITVAAMPLDRTIFDKSTPVIKIHGSTNWLYCDNCRQLYWFHPDEAPRIADQLIRADDLVRMRKYLSQTRTYVDQTLDAFTPPPSVRCLCSEDVGLGSRIATFSYRKALDFPMFQKSWFAAEELLRAADKWVFIGYSLPAADYEFKYLMKRTQLSRRIAPRFLVSKRRLQTRRGQSAR